MKKFIFIFFVLVFSGAIQPVFAEEGTMRPGLSGTIKNVKQVQRTEKTTARLQERAEKELTRRITALQNLITRLNELKRLSADQKSSFTSQVQTEITNLTALQTKIQADTDNQTLRTDVQSIITSYRVYALFMPQIQIMGAADRILTITEQMNIMVTKLETKINEAQSAGKNVTELQTALAGMKAKIADAKTQAQSAIDLVTPLTPAGYPGNKTTLQMAREKIQTAHKDLVIAQQDAKKIIRGLGLSKSEVSATPSL